MADALSLTWQPSLFGFDETPGLDASFRTLEHIQLDASAWVEHAPGWLSGSDRVFELILEGREWQQRSRQMYDRRVREPRLTSPWSLDSGEPLVPPTLEDVRLALSERYGRVFDSVGFNLYRDGDDSVAWHGDRIPTDIRDPVVVLVSLGEPRKFLLRPKGGGSSKAFVLGRGDLLVTGGTTQRTWEHSVPKVAQAGPRISVAYRHGVGPAGYADKRVEPPDDEGPEIVPDDP